MSSEDANCSADSRVNQTLRNVQELLGGRNIPGKVLLTRKSGPLEPPSFQERALNFSRSSSVSDAAARDGMGASREVELQNTNKSNDIAVETRLKLETSNVEAVSIADQKYVVGARAINSARIMKFNKVLSETTIMLDRLRELAWSGVPSYMRPTIWKLLLGYAPTNSERRGRVLGRKRMEYLDYVAQFYEIPDTERSEEEISMLRQISVDCPRTLPNVHFFQQAQVQKSLERILYTWAIRHPASGYVQGINDLATPFLVVFLSEHFDGEIDSWSITNLSPDKILDMEADCFWCLSMLLHGMQDHYTFAQPGIQRLVFKLREFVRRIDEPVSRHMDAQGLDFLQFAFRWFNCLLIREIPFHLANRLWDTYLAEGDALPDFLIYLFASFLSTWSDKLLKLDFQEMVMFLQHIPTSDWTEKELEMVLSRAYVWHTMFSRSPSHLAH